MQPTPHSHATRKNGNEIKTLPNHTRQPGRRDATSNASNRENTPPPPNKKANTQQYNKQTVQYLQNAILSLETRVQHPNTRYSHTLDHPHRCLIKRIKISHTSTPIWRIVTSISMLQQERRVQVTRRTAAIRKSVRTLSQRLLHVLPSHMIILGRTKHQIYIIP